MGGSGCGYTARQPLTFNRVGASHAEHGSFHRFALKVHPPMPNIAFTVDVHAATSIARPGPERVTSIIVGALP